MGQGSLYPQLSELQSEQNSGGLVTPTNGQDAAPGGQKVDARRHNIATGRQDATTGGQSQDMFAVTNLLTLC